MKVEQSWRLFYEVFWVCAAVSRIVGLSETEAEFLLLLRAVRLDTGQNPGLDKHGSVGVIPVSCSLLKDAEENYILPKRHM
jgi:hypothetical protein